jgi:hypothetical protein
MEWTFNCVADNAFYVDIDYANLTGETLKASVTVAGVKTTVELPPTCSASRLVPDPFQLVFSEPLSVAKGAGKKLVFELDAESAKKLAAASEKEKGGKRRRRGFKDKFLLRSVILKSAYPPPYRGYGGNPDTTKLSN